MFSKERRKSDGKADRLTLVTVHVPPAKLRAIFGPRDAKLVGATAAKAFVPSTPASAAAGKGAPARSSALHDDDASESAPGTPVPATPVGDTTAAAEGTPGPATLAPPAAAAAAAGSKKKGVKRSSAVAGLDGAAAGTASGPGSTADDAGTPRARTKPGPKKRAKLDDAGNDSGRGSSGNGGGAAGGGNGGTHKLGPKASMGAINAGLRALDRSGKPCRRWAKGGFRLKSFTGVVWEIPRWKAPTPSAAGDADEDASATVTATASASVSVSASVSAAGSNKENEAKDKAAAADTKDGVPAVNGTGSSESNGINGKPEIKAGAKPVAATTTTSTANGSHPPASSDSDVDMINAPSTQPSPPAASTAEPTEGSSTPVAIAA